MIFAGVTSQSSRMRRAALAGVCADSAVKFKASGARLLIVDRQFPRADLELDPAFRDLDTVLFKSKEEADQYPLKTYQVLSPN